jgi:nucleoside-diphosphate-sugar epimerase
MKDIVITGATGVIGQRAVRELRAAGHRVRGLTRADADVYDETSLRRAFDGADVVVNLLTKIPPADRMADRAAWAENDRLRTEASAAIARAADGRRLIQESIAFVYADGGAEWLDEGAEAIGGGVTSSALVAERNAGANAVVLRFGLFTGPESGFAVASLAAAREGRSLAVGRRDPYRPMIWLDDAATAIVAALDVAPGVYNVADGEPATVAEIDAALAAAVGVDALRPGPVLDTPQARSQRVSSARLREASGWAPRVRAGTEAWARLAQSVQ